MSSKFFDVDIEQAILGAILQKNDILDTLELKAEHFYRESHKVIYSKMLDIRKKNEDINYLSLNDALGDKVNDVGGLEYLLHLSKNYFTTAGTEGHAKIVKEYYLRREYYKVGGELKVLSGEEEDITMVGDKIQARLLKIGNDSVADETQCIKDVVMNNVENIGNNVDFEYVGVPSKFGDMDNMLGGFKKGALYIIAARPAMGKTAFALNLVANFARQGKTVLMFSLEMTNEELVGRMLSSDAHIQGEKLSRPKLLEAKDWDRLWESAGRLAEYPIYLNEKASSSPSYIRSVARKEQVKHGIDCIVIDYLQLMEGDTRNENRQVVVSEISRSLKSIAKDLGVPVIALSQLSRSVEARQDKHPMLSDLRESGSIEQDADVVMFLYRDEYYNEATEFPNIVEVVVAKHRSGKVGTVKLYFDKDTSTFRGLAKEEYEKYCKEANRTPMEQLGEP